MIEAQLTPHPNSKRVTFEEIPNGHIMTANGITLLNTKINDATYLKVSHGKYYHINKSDGSLVLSTSNNGRTLSRAPIWLNLGPFPVRFKVNGLDNHVEYNEHIPSVNF